MYTSRFMQSSNIKSDATTEDYQWIPSDLANPVQGL